MQKEDRKVLAEILYGMAGNFGDTMDDYTIKLWARVLEIDKISIDQIKSAAITVLRTRKISKMPTLAEFLEAINGSPDSGAQAQADLVLSTMRSQGFYAKVKFQDPVTEHLMTVRWPHQSWYRDLLTEEIKWWRKEFVEAYKDLSKNPASLQKSKQITASPELKKLSGTIGG